MNNIFYPALPNAIGINLKYGLLFLCVLLLIMLGLFLAVFFAIRSYKRKQLIRGLLSQSQQQILLQKEYMQQELQKHKNNELVVGFVKYLVFFVEKQSYNSIIDLLSPKGFSKLECEQIEHSLYAASQLPLLLEKKIKTYIAHS